MAPMDGADAQDALAALQTRHNAELASLADAMDETAFADWSYPGRGLIRGEALARWVRDQTGGRPIEGMKLPLGIVATDLDSGQPILFQRGDTGLAVRASSAARIKCSVAHSVELPGKNITESQPRRRTAGADRLGLDRGCSVQRIREPRQLVGAPEARARRIGPSVGSGFH